MESSIEKDNVKNFINNIIKNTDNKFIKSILNFIIIIGLILFLLFIFYYYFKKSRECAAMNKYYGSVNGKITSLSKDEAQYKLRDYYIQTAYNCCASGNYSFDYVDICNLKAVLKEGVRCLDFEIFSLDDNPIVSTNTTSKFNEKETFNYISFSNVLSVIRNDAFNGSTSPNFTDPVILHLRIKSNNIVMYNNLAKIMESYNDLLLDKNYSYENNGIDLANVTLSELLGKIIIIVDKSNTTYVNTDFYEYINITSNSPYMRLYRYYDVKNSPNIEELTNFNKRRMSVCLPNNESNPTNCSSVALRECGVQMIGMRYGLQDSYLAENKIFFDNNGRSFVLKPERLRYFPVQLTTPTPQNPKVSFETRNIESNYIKFNI